MKSYLFDTNVLVAAFIKEHPHHSFCLDWIVSLQSQKVKMWICQHALAEFYNVTSQYPFPKLMPLATLNTLIQESIVKVFDVIDLSTRNYRNALERISLRGYRGGLIYDALHVEAALKKNCDAIVTMNEKDFIKIVEINEVEILNPLNQTP